MFTNYTGYRYDGQDNDVISRDFIFLTGCKTKLCELKFGNVRIYCQMERCKSSLLYSRLIIKNQQKKLHNLMKSQLKTTRGYVTIVNVT